MATDRKCSTCSHQTVCGHWRDYLNASRSDTRLLCGHLLPEWRGDDSGVVRAAREWADAKAEFIRTQDARRLLRAGEALRAAVDAERGQRCD